jgi:GxxExxY protein
VLNTLGTGFLGKVYETPLARELRQAGLSVAQKKDTTVYYGGIAVGYYVDDILS